MLDWKEGGAGPAVYVFIDENSICKWGVSVFRFIFLLKSGFLLKGGGCLHFLYSDVFIFSSVSILSITSVLGVKNKKKFILMLFLASVRYVANVRGDNNTTVILEDHSDRRPLLPQTQSGM